MRQRLASGRGRLGTSSQRGLRRPAHLSLRAQHPRAALVVQHVQVAGVGMADLHQRFQKAPQQFVQIARFQLHAEQLVEGLCFGLADLIVGVVQRQDDAEMQLLAHPLEVGVFVREQLAQHRASAAGRIPAGLRRSLLGGRFSLARRRPLYSTCSMNLSGGWPLARMRAAAPGVMEASATRILGSNCRGLELAALQLREETPIERFGVRQQKHRQAMQVDAKLIAEYIGGVGQFRRYFREWHLDLLSASRGKALGFSRPNNVAKRALQ